MSTAHMTMKDVATELAISVDQAKKLVEKRKLAAVNVGVGERVFWRVSRDDFDAYLEQQRAATAARFSGGAA